VDSPRSHGGEAVLERGTYLPALVFWMSLTDCGSLLAIVLVRARVGSLTRSSDRPKVRDLLGEGPCPDRAGEKRKDLEIVVDLEK
jgi:hypothetical protein